MSFISKIRTPSNTVYEFKYGVYPVNGTQTSATNVWTGNIDVSSLYDGLTIAYYLPYAGTTTGATLNLTLNNNQKTGAIPIYYTGNSANTNMYEAGSTILLTYWSAGSISISGTATTTASWRRADYDTNSTYSNASLGNGYGTCATAASTTAKVVTLSNYALVINGFVSVKFTYDVPASATLNINSKGAKGIKYKGEDISANIIKGGDIATFVYDGTNYHLIAIDKHAVEILTAADVGAVPTSRTVNGQSLSSDISLTASDVGALPASTTIPSATTTTPKMDGTASAGSETTWAKGDHVHPTDTSRAAVDSPTFTGTPTAPTASVGTNTTQLATTEFVQTAASGKQTKPTITSTTLSASGWSNGSYAGLQTTYPVASYDIEIEPNGDSITSAQLSAWNDAQVLGSATTNTLKALGTVPTVDIPIIVKVWAK